MVLSKVFNVLSSFHKMLIKIPTRCRVIANWNYYTDVYALSKLTIVSRSLDYWITSVLQSFGEILKFEQTNVHLVLTSTRAAGCLCNWERNEQYKLSLMQRIVALPENVVVSSLRPAMVRNQPQDGRDAQKFLRSPYNMAIEFTTTGARVSCKCTNLNRKINGMRK